MYRTVTGLWYQPYWFGGVDGVPLTLGGVRSNRIVLEAELVKPAVSVAVHV